MSQVIHTQSIEDATLTVTNGGANSDDRLLKNRDLRVKALDVASGASTVQVEIDYGTLTSADDIILGNITTDADVAISLDYWTGAVWSTLFTESNDTYTNANYFKDFSQIPATKFRLNIAPATSAAIEVACIFLGIAYTLPVNYQIPANIDTYYKGNKQIDAHGYPYSETIDSNEKYIWDLEYRLTDAQIATLRTNLADANYDRKPFFFQDDNIDSSWRLVRLDQEAVFGEYIAYNFKRVPLRLIEL